MGECDNEDVVVLPNHLFVRMTQTERQEQDDNIIRRWVDPHRLKHIDSWWTKNNPLEERRLLIKSLHDPPAYGHPRISRTVDFVE